MTETSVTTPTEMMPGKHGGMLRRGGGRPPISKDKKEALEFLRDHALDAAKSLVVRALRGDTRAIELVLSYGIGKPSDRMEITGPDGGPVAFTEGWDDHERAVLRDLIEGALAEPAKTAAGGTEG